MGFRCSSLQVFTAQTPSDQTVQAIVEATRQLVQLDNPHYQEISQEESAVTDRTKWATRSLIVAVPTSPASAVYPWVGVYDETTEEDPPNLERLTLALSQKLGSKVLGIIANSSLELFLADKGKVVDGYDSSYLWEDDDEEAFDEETRQRQAAFKGQPQLWGSLLAPGKTLADLQRNWQEMTLAYDQLLELCPLLQLDPQLGLSSYYDLEYQLEAFEQEEQPIFARFRFIRLFYRASEPVAQPEPPKGPPSLKAMGGTAKLELSATDHFDTSLIYAFNAGGDGVGLQLTLWGLAIEQKLLEPATARFYTAAFFANPALQPEEIPLGSYQTEEGQQVYYLSLPEFKLAGFSRLDFAFRGKALSAGKAELYLGFAPLENKEAGSDSWVIPVEVHPAPTRRPVASVYEGPHTSYLLRALEPTDQLGGLVVLGSGWPEQANQLAEIFERWSEVIRHYRSPLQPKNKKLKYTGSFVSDFSAKSKMFKLEVGEFSLHQEWLKMREELKVCQWFYASADSPSDPAIFPPRIFQSGFSFRNGSPLPLPPGTAAEEVVANLSLFIDLKGLASRESQLVRAVLTELVDELMGLGIGLQAGLFQWKWSYITPDQSTPYEALGGISYQHNNRSWCTRYLRGISEQLWLGRELAQSLSDRERESLEQIAKVRPVGEGLRLVLREGVPIERLEEVLSGLLPVKFTRAT